MNKYLEEMNEAQKDYSVQYILFMQSYSDFKNEIYCFFEGVEDYAYYGIRIKEHTNYSDEVINKYICNGRNNVKKIYSLINRNSKYNSKKILYFIDKDFEPEEINGIFQTNYYSIENYYTGVNTFLKILLNEFLINTNDKIIETLKLMYEARQKEFHEKVTYLNAWCCFQRKNQGDQKIDFSKIKLSNCLDICIERIKEKIVIEKNYLEKNTNNFKELNNDFIEIYELFKTSESKNTFFRGKFEIEFLVKILENIRKKIKDKVEDFKNINCPRIDYNTHTLSVLSKYAETPNDLKEYLINYKMTC